MAKDDEDDIKNDSGSVKGQSVGVSAAGGASTSTSGGGSSSSISKKDGVEKIKHSALVFSRSAETVGTNGFEQKHPGQRPDRAHVRRPSTGRRQGANEQIQQANWRAGCRVAKSVALIRTSKSCTKECEILRTEYVTECLPRVSPLCEEELKSDGDSDTFLGLIEEEEEEFDPDVTISESTDLCIDNDDPEGKSSPSVTSQDGSLCQFEAGARGSARKNPIEKTVTDVPPCGLQLDKINQAPEDFDNEILCSRPSTKAAENKNKAGSPTLGKDEESFLCWSVSSVAAEEPYSRCSSSNNSELSYSVSSPREALTTTTNINKSVPPGVSTEVATKNCGANDLPIQMSADSSFSNGTISSQTESTSSVIYSLVSRRKRRESRPQCGKNRKVSPDKTVSSKRTNRLQKGTNDVKTIASQANQETNTGLARQIPTMLNDPGSKIEAKNTVDSDALIKTSYFQKALRQRVSCFNELISGQPVSPKPELRDRAQQRVVASSESNSSVKRSTPSKKRTPFPDELTKAVTEALASGFFQQCQLTSDGEGMSDYLLKVSDNLGGLVLGTNSNESSKNPEEGSHECGEKKRQKPQEEDDSPVISILELNPLVNDHPNFSSLRRDHNDVYHGDKLLPVYSSSNLSRSSVSIHGEVQGGAPSKSRGDTQQEKEGEGEITTPYKTPPEENKTRTAPSRGETFTKREKQVTGNSSSSSIQVMISQHIAQNKYTEAVICNASGQGTCANTDKLLDVQAVEVSTDLPQNDNPTVQTMSRQQADMENQVNSFSREEDIPLADTESKPTGMCLGRISVPSLGTHEYLPFLNKLREDKRVRKEELRHQNRVNKIQRISTDSTKKASGFSEDECPGDAESVISTPVCPIGHEVPPDWKPGRHGSHPMAQLTACYSSEKKARKQRRFSRKKGKIGNRVSIRKKVDDINNGDMPKRPSAFETSQAYHKKIMESSRSCPAISPVDCGSTDTDRAQDVEHDCRDYHQVGNVDGKRLFYENSCESPDDSNLDLSPLPKRITSQVKLLKTIDELYGSPSSEEAECEMNFGDKTASFDINQQMSLFNYYATRLKHLSVLGTTRGQESSSNKVPFIRISRAAQEMPSALDNQRLTSLYECRVKKTVLTSKSRRQQETMDKTRTRSEERADKASRAVKQIWVGKEYCRAYSRTAQSAKAIGSKGLQSSIPEECEDTHQPPLKDKASFAENWLNPRKNTDSSTNRTQHSTYLEVLKNSGKSVLFDSKTGEGSNHIPVYVYRKHKTTSSDYQVERDNHRSPRKEEKLRHKSSPPGAYRESLQRNRMKVRFADAGLDSGKERLMYEMSDEDTWCSTVNAMLLRASKVRDDQLKNDHRYPKPESARVVSPVPPKSPTFLKELLKQDTMDRKQAKGLMKLERKFKESTVKHERNEERASRSPTSPHFSSFPSPSSFSVAQPSSQLSTMQGTSALVYTVPFKDGNHGTNINEKSAGVLKISIQMSKRAQDRAWLTHERLKRQRPAVVTEYDSFENKALPKKLAPLRFSRPINFQNPDNRSLDRMPMREVMSRTLAGLTTTQQACFQPKSVSQDNFSSNKSCNYLLDQHSETLRYYRNPYMDQRGTSIVPLYSDLNNNARVGRLKLPHAAGDSEAALECAESNFEKQDVTDELEFPNTGTVKIDSLIFLSDAVGNRAESNTSTRSGKGWGGLDFTGWKHPLREVILSEQHNHNCTSSASCQSSSSFHLTESNEEQLAKYDEFKLFISGFKNIHQVCLGWNKERKSDRTEILIGVDLNGIYQNTEGNQNFNNNVQLDEDHREPAEPEEKETLLQVLLEIETRKAGRPSTWRKKLEARGDDVHEESELTLNEGVVDSGRVTCGTFYLNHWQPNYMDTVPALEEYTLEAETKSHLDNEDDNQHSPEAPLIPTIVSDGQNGGTTQMYQNTQESNEHLERYHRSPTNAYNIARMTRVAKQRDYFDQSRSFVQDAFVGWKPNFTVMGTTLPLNRKDSVKPCLGAGISNLPKGILPSYPYSTQLDYYAPSEHQHQESSKVPDRTIVSSANFNARNKNYFADAKGIQYKTARNVLLSNNGEKTYKKTQEAFNFHLSTIDEVTRESTKEFTNVNLTADASFCGDDSEQQNYFSWEKTKIPPAYRSSEMITVMDFQEHARLNDQESSSSHSVLSNSSMSRFQEKAEATDTPSAAEVDPRGSSSTFKEEADLNVFDSIHDPPNSLCTLTNAVELPCSSMNTGLDNHTEKEAIVVKNGQTCQEAHPSLHEQTIHLTDTANREKESGQCEDNVSQHSYPHSNTESQISDVFDDDDVDVTDVMSEQDQTRAVTPVDVISPSLACPAPSPDHVKEPYSMAWYQLSQDLQRYLTLSPGYSQSLIENPESQVQPHRTPLGLGAKKVSYSLSEFLNKNFLRALRRKELLDTVGLDKGRLNRCLQLVTKRRGYLPVFQIRTSASVELMPQVIVVNHCAEAYIERGLPSFSGSVQSLPIFYTEDGSGCLSGIYTVDWILEGVYTLEPAEAEPATTPRDAGVDQAHFGRLIQHCPNSSDRAFSSQRSFLIGDEMTTLDEAQKTLVTVHDKAGADVARHFSLMCGWVPARTATCVGPAEVCDDQYTVLECPEEDRLKIGSSGMCSDDPRERSGESSFLPAISSGSQRLSSGRSASNQDVAKEITALPKIFPLTKDCSPCGQFLKISKSLSNVGGVCCLPAICRSTGILSSPEPHSSKMMCLRCGVTVDYPNTKIYEKDLQSFEDRAKEIPGTDIKTHRDLIRAHQPTDCQHKYLEADRLSQRELCKFWEVSELGLAIPVPTQVIPRPNFSERRPTRLKPATRSCMSPSAPRKSSLNRVSRSLTSFLVSSEISEQRLTHSQENFLTPKNTDTSLTTPLVQLRVDPQGLSQNTADIKNIKGLRSEKLPRLIQPQQSAPELTPFVKLEHASQNTATSGRFDFLLQDRSLPSETKIQASNQDVPLADKAQPSHQYTMPVVTPKVPPKKDTDSRYNKTPTMQILPKDNKESLLSGTKSVSGLNSSYASVKTTLNNLKAKSPSHKITQESTPLLLPSQGVAKLKPISRTGESHPKVPIKPAGALQKAQPATNHVLKPNKPLTSHLSTVAPLDKESRRHSEIAVTGWTSSQVRDEADDEQELMEKRTWSQPVIPPPFPSSLNPPPPTSHKVRHYKSRTSAQLTKAHLAQHRRNLTHISHSYVSPYYAKKEVKRARTPESDSGDDRSSISRITTISGMTSSSSESSSTEKSSTDDSDSDSGSSATGSDFFTRYANKGGPTSVDDIFKRTLPKQRLGFQLTRLKEAKEKEEVETLGYLRGREGLTPPPREQGDGVKVPEVDFPLSDYDMCSDAEEVKEMWKLCFPEVDFWDRNRKRKFKKTKILS